MAEKLEAMVKLDLANSRMKDFYDVWLIVTQLGFDHDIMSKAIAATFKRRKTVFPDGHIPALTPYFYGDAIKKSQWNAFLKKGKVAHGQLSLQRACDEIRENLLGVFENVRGSKGS